MRPEKCVAPGVGVLGAVAVEQVHEMRQIGAAVARGGVLRALHREEDRPRGGLQRREGTRVQLVGELVAQGVVLDGRHVGAPVVRVATLQRPARK
ncbi:hypothetical protein Salmuc_00546 [Salipiger mucosus DSM 16094]|uniref:Uncharacterized protein n=1 Tax=Salipiger mucosus DSM 16094 TaxID=1123237 RepID=S9SF90_9RHOB|nr:hypothetical protein Salmuc_00546 [Salipiger mucosus DSM 16094]